MYELTPHNGRKSFYGKALVEITESGKNLYSYRTLVLSVDNNNVLHRHWDCVKPSCTTMAHIKSFLCEIGIGLDFTAKDYMKLPYEKAYPQNMKGDNI